VTEEISIAGVFVPTFAVCCISAIGLSVLLSKATARFVSPDLRRFVWHAPLFDLAIFIVILGIVHRLAETLLS
jgi:hypothetical protein